MLTHSENIFSLDRQTKLRRTNFKIKAHQITERIQLDIVCVCVVFLLFDFIKGDFTHNFRFEVETQIYEPAITKIGIKFSHSLQPQDFRNKIKQS